MAAGDKGDASPSKSDLVIGEGALRTFKSKIDKILTDLEKPSAPGKKIPHVQLTRKAFSGEGSPFTEADDLFAKYNDVHVTLTTLSKLLGEQITAIGIAVRASEVGYDGLEDDLRRRFKEIQELTDAFAKGEKDPWAAIKQGDGTPKHTESNGDGPL